MERTSITGIVGEPVRFLDAITFVFPLRIDDSNTQQVYVSGYLGRSLNDFNTGNRLKLYGRMDQETNLFRASELVISPLRETDLESGVLKRH